MKKVITRITIKQAGPTKDADPIYLKPGPHEFEKSYAEKLVLKGHADWPEDIEAAAAAAAADGGARVLTGQAALESTAGKPVVTGAGAGAGDNTPPDVLDQSVPKIEELLPSLDVAALEDLLKRENEGKTRKGLISTLEAEIEKRKTP